MDTMKMLPPKNNNIFI